MEDWSTRRVHEEAYGKRLKKYKGKLQLGASVLAIVL